MKYVFFDKSKSVYVKVFPTPQSLEKELFGIKCFSEYVEVPKIKVLDCKVAAISELNGFLGYQIIEEDLNLLIVDLLLQMKPKKIDASNYQFSIFAEIEKLKQFFAKDKSKVVFLINLSEELKSTTMYPVHGDIQKLNTIIAEGKLGLIDFEHFILAPLELELVNNLFFNDGNCLNVNEVIKILPKRFMKLKLLKKLLYFYTLKQISFGMEEEKAVLRFNQAIAFLSLISSENKRKFEVWKEILRHKEEVH